MKHFSAILTALVITAIIGLGVGVVGVSAIANTNTVPIQDSRTSAGNSSQITSASAGNSSASAQVQQLQQEVSSLQSQLGQAGQVVQQYQSILIQLQQRGVIRIDQNGNIFLPQGNQFGDDDH